MPYKPGTVTSEDRSRAFNILWIGLPASLINIVWMTFAPQDTIAPNLFGVLAAITLAGLPFASRHDEFIQAHLWTAARWAVGVAGALMLIGVFAILAGLDLLAEVSSPMVLSILTAVFHVALGASHLRERLAR